MHEGSELLNRGIKLDNTKKPETKQGSDHVLDYMKARELPLTREPAPVDQAKGNALLKKLFSSKLPMVPDPAPQSNPKQET